MKESDWLLLVTVGLALLYALPRGPETTVIPSNEPLTSTMQGRMLAGRRRER